MDIYDAINTMQFVAAEMHFVRPCISTAAAAAVDAALRLLHYLSARAMQFIIKLQLWDNSGTNKRPTENGTNADSSPYIYYTPHSKLDLALGSYSPHRINRTN